MANALRYFAFLMILMIAVPHVLAASEKDTKADQIRRLQQAQRKAEQERSLLEQERNQLSEQKAAAESELGAVRKKVDGESRRAAALSRDVGAMRSARDAAAAKLAATEAELRKTQEAQRLAEAESKRLQAALAAEKQQLAVCTERGQALRKVSGEVLELYEKKSCLDSSLQGEPFTGLKRVEIENAIEDMREKLDSQRTGS